MRIRRRVGVLLTTAVLAAAEVRAQSVQLAPFAGYQFGGSFQEQATGTTLSLRSSLSYGGTMDIAINDHWRVEMLYSRQPTDIGRSDGPAGFDVKVERYMAGIVEETGAGRSRAFGVVLAGVTRFVPGLSGYDSDQFFTVALGLGVKHYLSDHFALRGEIRGFYTVTETNGGVYCTQGTCLFSFGGHGLWQGDVSGGLVLAF
jgi:hypothetical protein